MKAYLTLSFINILAKLHPLWIIMNKLWINFQVCTQNKEFTCQIHWCRIISNITINKQCRPWSGSSYKSCLIWFALFARVQKVSLWGKGLKDDSYTVYTISSVISWTGPINTYLVTCLFVHCGPKALGSWNPFRTRRWHSRNLIIISCSVVIPV